MKLGTYLLSAVILGCPMAGGAQMMSMGSQGAAMGTPGDPAKAEDAMLSAFEEEFTAVAKAMPAAKYSFAPSTAAFAPAQDANFAGVRTFAQEITHVMEANYYFYGLVGGTKPDVDMKSLSAMTAKDQILPALAASFTFAHKAVATITPANAFVTIKGADGMNTRATLASFGVAHGSDHYGQMVEYLRMNGVVPPGSK